MTTLQNLDIYKNRKTNPMMNIVYNSFIHFRHVFRFIFSLV